MNAMAAQRHHRLFNRLLQCIVILMTLARYAAFASKPDNWAMESITASGWAS